MSTMNIYKLHNETSKFQKERRQERRLGLYPAPL
jgi:hypothetical protein